MEITKEDWKTFREKIGPWQESYINRLNQEYRKILDGSGSASDKFWHLYERIKDDSRRPGVQLNLKKGDVAFDLARLLKDEVITEKDLYSFSDDLREHVIMLREHLFS